MLRRMRNDGLLRRFAPRNDGDGVEPAISPTVVPAKAGTHNHRVELLKQAVTPAMRHNSQLWLWVPGQARDDTECVRDL